ncbi:MAG TPA: VTT domain-containing protein, partial [Tepidisphaeraceae bacterium]|nr:VTT domain-containing protein [Tepidisphaeraceae bacterium]
MSRVATLAFRPFKLSIVQAAIAALLVIAAAILLAPTVRDPAMPSEWMRATLQASTLAIATLGSEDLTCITAAQLVRSGQLSWTVAIVGCTVGIYFGDLGLWLVGRLLLGGARRTPWVSSQLPMAALGKCETWFDRRGGAAIFAARFLPGFRLPMYLAAGAIGRRPWQFAGWSLLAAVIWTPALIMATAIFGD